MKILLFLFCLPWISVYSQLLKVNIQAKSAILINPANGAVLFEKNADALCFPASTTKIATVIFALEGKEVDFDAKMIVSEEEIASISAPIKQANYDEYPSHLLEHDAVKMGLKKGELVSIRTLLFGTMLQSANDAANAVAKYCSGSIVEFMKELNAYLQELGLTQTHLTNPHGLHHPKMVTTAREFAKLTAHALENPAFRYLVKTKSFKPPLRDAISQTNRLLRQGTHFYPKAIGVKTGYTIHAKFNLVAAAEVQGRCLVAILFNCTTSEQRYKDAIALFEAAFKEKPVTRTLFAKESESFSLAVSKARNSLKARLFKDVMITYFPSEKPNLRAQVLWKKLLPPIQEGQLVGCIKVVDDRDQIVAAAPLYATTDVQKTFFYQMLDMIRGFFQKLRRILVR